MTEWRPVVGWEGYYLVNQNGEVLAEERRHMGRGGTMRRYRRHLMKVGGDGRVGLCVDGEAWRVNPGRFVLQAFDRDPRPGENVVHLDGNVHNNRLENLCWGRRAEVLCSQQHSKESLTDAQKLAIRTLLQCAVSEDVISEAMRLSKSTVRRERNAMKKTGVMTDA